MAGKLKKLLSFVGYVIIVVLITVLVRTFTFHQRTISGSPCTPLDTDFIHGNTTQVLSRFQQALRHQTVSTDVHEYNAEELGKLVHFIEKSYPTIHSSELVSRDVIANYSLLYSIRGIDPSLKPFMLTGHLDVVPVPEEDWEAPPFGGEIKHGYIYGRGTIDDKQIVFGILEALEFLLQRGHTPRRSFYLAFGHDEETGGHEGARRISQALHSRGVSLEFLLDEGMPILIDSFPGINTPVALVGSSEKGYVSIQLSVKAPGGHSSMPGKESSIGILAKAISRLEGNPHPSMFGTGPERGTFEHLAPYMDFPYRLLMSNIWLFSPLISMVLSSKPESNAITRTTTAVTMFKAGIKENVIAPYAEAIVNHRIHPSQTVQQVIDYDKLIVNDDRVEFSEAMEVLEPLPKSPYGDEHFGWQTIKTSILQVWGQNDTVVAPSVTIGNTDTYHYIGLTSNIYRFSPTVMFPSDLGRFHGLNERISVANYEQAINFYYHVMMNADTQTLEPLHRHTDF